MRNTLVQRLAHQRMAELETSAGHVRRGAHQLIGSWVYGLGEFDAVARLAAKKADVLEQIVTRRFAGEEGGEAFRVAAGATEGKVVIDWTR